MTCLSANEALVHERANRFARPAARSADVLASPPTRLSSPGRRFELTKRSFDILLGGVLLLAVSVVLMGCAFWIGGICREGVIYSQWRVGRNGRLFRVYKLRTMRSDAERHGARYADRKDDRILPGCRWMRMSHVDELPQLWNILKGDMSLVGPRPERPEMFEALRGTAPGFERRLAAKPGLTGPAQLHVGYTNDAAGARRKLAWDLRYLRRRSVRRDAVLLLRTLPKLWDTTAC